MFAKLKQKLNVDAVAGGDRQEMTSDKYGHMAGDMPGLHVRKESVSDAESSSGHFSPSSNNVPDPMSGDGSKEEVLYMLMKRTEQVKKLESKIGDLVSVVREKAKTLDKLELTVEAERLESSKKLQELEKKYETNEDIRMEEKHESLVRKEQLLIAEESLSECRTRLETAEMTQDKCDSLQTQVEQLNEYSAQLAQHSEELEHDMKRKGSMIEELTSERQSLKKTVDKLQETLTTKAADMGTLSISHADLQDAHQKLQHSMQLHQQKMSSLLEEKDEQLSHIRERARSLEQRLQDTGLSDDERFTAIEIERNSLELRLTETREQLIQVKSTWSDKITLLEKQIANLNGKMGEDREEFGTREATSAQLISELRAQVKSLTGQLDSADKTADAKQMTSGELCRSLKQQKLQLSNDLETEREKYSAMERTLSERITSLEAHSKTLQKARDQDKAVTQQKLSQIESRQSDWLEKEIDAERRRTQMDEQIARLQQENTELQKTNEKLLADIQNREDDITKLSQTVSSLESGHVTIRSESSETLELLRATQLELQMCNKDKSELLLRNAQLFQDVELQRRLAISAQTDMEHAAKQANGRASQLQESLTFHKERADTAEQEHEAVRGQATSEELVRLHSELTTLNTQMTEKNRTIKMQQQRLADLKKTLQRELRVQALPNGCDTPPEAALGRVSSSDSLNRLTASASATLPLSNSPELANGVSCERPCCRGSECNEYITDVNFQYLKHVILKFMLSRETEAKQLIKAVSMLLHFSTDEQILIQKTLNWKSSWFAARPELGQGQKSHVVPSSY